MKISEKDNEFYEITVEVTNSNDVAPTDSHDTHIFQIEIELGLEGASFTPIEIAQLDEKPGISRSIFGTGLNCHVVCSDSSTLRSESTPVFNQTKIKSRVHTDLGFVELSQNPIQSLTRLMDTMEEHLQTSVDKGADVQHFSDEVVRFKNGISCLEKYNDVREAFILMNKSFSQSSKVFTQWRTFQLVFIVMNIPDIICRQYVDVENTNDRVDVIYFPTGGGKTEAYLGLVVFAAFFDRLRGKKAGITAITKFPLRLLSLQQIQRIVDIFAQAELIRREHPTISHKSYEQFSTGYYVGKNNTPNELVDNYKNPPYNILETITNNPEEGERFKIVSHCPFCNNESVQIVADLDTTRLKHICDNTDCGKEIPVYISDYEIYRYLPTFLVTTIDKLAISGLSRNFRNIMGLITKKCPKHGFTSQPTCLERGKRNCDVDFSELQSVTLKDSTPSIMIQDEIHLIRESLGTFDSHYESFVDWLQTKVSDGKARMKIIAASATVSGFENQIEHLYLRKGVLFPHPGLEVHQSFYIESSKERERLIVGILPYNKTQIYCVVDIITYYEELLQKYYDTPSLLMKYCPSFTDDDDVRSFLRDYSVLLSYNLSKREGDAIGQSISTQINPDLRNLELRELVHKSM
ncbi:MAG: hypothetical protein ACTSRU_20575, partial [Candidatus Hodarchaeales archaeon]